MSVEVLLSYDSGFDNILCLLNQETKYIYEKGSEAPRLVIRARSNIGVDIEAGCETFHLPCFQENSDHLMHAIGFQLRDKTVLIRTF